MKSKFLTMIEQCDDKFTENKNQVILKENDESMEDVVKAFEAAKAVTSSARKGGRAVGMSEDQLKTLNDRINKIRVSQTVMKKLGEGLSKLKKGAFAPIYSDSTTGKGSIDGYKADVGSGSILIKPGSKTKGGYQCNIYFQSKTSSIIYGELTVDMDEIMELTSKENKNILDITDITLNKKVGGMEFIMNILGTVLGLGEKEQDKNVLIVSDLSDAYNCLRLMAATGMWKNTHMTSKGCNKQLEFLLQSPSFTNLRKIYNPVKEQEPQVLTNFLSGVSIENVDALFYTKNH